MAKHEWKKSEKAWYAAAGSPTEVTVPSFRFFVLEGRGDPNGPGFATRVETLYALAYGVRMSHKSDLNLPGFFEYTVYPLEGVWDLGSAPGPGPILKSDLVYRIMIRQPEFVDQRAFERVAAGVLAKKTHLPVAQARLEVVDEGRCLQMLHVGPFDAEPASFGRMADFCRKERLARVGHTHREIYLSDPSRVAPSEYRTILRYPVRDNFACD